MAGAMMNYLPSYFDSFNEFSLLIFSDTDNYQQFTTTLEVEYTVSKHTSDFCTLRNCKYHILLYSTTKIVDYMASHLSQITFMYYMIDALYGTYKYFIAGESIVTSEGALMTQLRNAVKYNRFHPHMEVRPSVLKKRLIRKKRRLHKRHIKSKSISTQTSEKVFAGRVESILRSDLAFEFMRIVDCLVDRHGSVESRNISFRCNMSTS